jgi:hypothetical protein
VLKMVKWFHSIDWVPLCVGALVFLVAQDFLSWFGFPDQNLGVHSTGYAANQNADETPWYFSSAVWTAIFTGLLTYFNFRLLGVTVVAANAAKSAAEAATASAVLAQTTADQMRSAIRGAGWSPTPGWFRIEASNGGTGAAVIESVEWGIANLNNFLLPPPYLGPFPSNEMLTPGARAQLVRAVQVIPQAAPQMIFFRLNYFDINRKAHHSIAHVMELGPTTGQQMLPTFLIPPAAFAIYEDDTFPIEGM